MASNSSVIDTASIKHTFADFKSITSNAWSLKFVPVNKKGLAFYLGILPKPNLYPQDVLIHLCLNNAEKRFNLKYEVSILNAKNEKCYTENYQWNYNRKYSSNIHVANFMLYDQLIKEANGFIRNGALTLFCEVKLLKADAKIMENSKSANLLPKMCDDIQSILTTGEHSDFVLTVGGKEFKVHKAILAARSSVFKAMLNADLEEKKKNRVDIIDVDLEVFEQLLAYIYSGTVTKLDEYALDLFIAADKYQLDELKPICAQFLSTNLTVETVANILLFADMHSGPELKANCIKFITSNSTKVMATDGWKQMVKTRIELLNELYEDIAKAHSVSN